MSDEDDEEEEEEKKMMTKVIRVRFSGILFSNIPSNERVREKKMEKKTHFSFCWEREEWKKKCNAFWKKITFENIIPNYFNGTEFRDAPSNVGVVLLWWFRICSRMPDRETNTINNRTNFFLMNINNCKKMAVKETENENMTKVLIERKNKCEKGTQ